MGYFFDGERYIFRYDKEYVKSQYSGYLDSDDYLYESFPVGLMDSSSRLDDADVVLYPPDEWMQKENRGEGKILSVEFSIRIK